MHGLVMTYNRIPYKWQNYNDHDLRYFTQSRTKGRKTKKRDSKEQNERLNRHFFLFFQKKRVCLKVHLLHDGTFKTVNFYGRDFCFALVFVLPIASLAAVLMRIYSSELITRH